MKPEDILQYCLANLEGTVRTESWGESGIFYNPGGVLKRGVYVLTVKEKVPAAMHDKHAISIRNTANFVICLPVIMTYILRCN